MPTKQQIKAKIEGELKSARLKEGTGKLKKAIEDVHAAKTVLTEKEQVVDDILTEYEDVIDLEESEDSEENTDDETSSSDG